MGKKLDIGVSNVARKGKKAWVGVENKARKIKKAWIGDANGIARLFFDDGVLVARLLVAISNGFIGSSSDNGASWEKGTNNKARYFYSSATNGEIIVVTVTGSSSYTESLFWYTRDGKTLTATQTDIKTLSSTTETNFVTYIPELEKFYCVRQQTSGYPAALYESSDGITWSRFSNICSIGTACPVVYDAKNKIMLVSGRQDSSGTQGIMYKENFSNSNGFIAASNYSTFGNVFNGIATHDGLSVSFCGSQNDVYPMYSTNGKTWTKGSKCGMSYPWSSILYADGKFVRVGDQFDTTGWYSTDGKTWTKATGSPFTIRQNKCLIHDGKQFIALQNSGLGFRSTDGTAWEDFQSLYSFVPTGTISTITFLA